VNRRSLLFTHHRVGCCAERPLVENSPILLEEPLNTIPKLLPGDLALQQHFILGSD
jgi:hypothetical protein